MKVRTRFAPSPTGYLHVGGVRTALFAWLTAKHAGGQFILRIEDTDRERHVEGSEQHIIDSLDWLGLHPDEGPTRQSERLDLYKEWGQKLIKTGRAYADPYSTEEVDDFRRQAQQSKKAFLFREFRPSDPPVWRPGLPLRFKSEPGPYRWQDAVMGDMSAGPDAVDDFILIKSDGYPTYNFAHIIDDHLSDITHVIRSQEFLSSMPKFLNIYDALGISWPVFATLPYVLGPDGRKKLSKRDGAKDILDYKREGYLPEALVSFLATLGWNDGTEQEIFTADELISKFDLGRVQRGGAEFDERRLQWVDGHFIRESGLDDLLQKAHAFWPDEANSFDDRYKKRVLALLQERLKYLAEIPRLSWFFFKEPSDTEISSQVKAAGQDTAGHLKAVITELDQSDFSRDDLQSRLNGLLGSLDTKPAVLFSEIRGATTGAEVSPELFGTLDVLGKEKTLQRLERAVAILEKT